jgi:hypothetical protein
LSSIIEAGRIKKNKGSILQEDVCYEMRFMDEDDLADMMVLQETIVQNLSDKEIFRTHARDYFLDHFKVENSVIGTFTDDGLIAYNVLYFPGVEGDNFGTDIDLPIDELDKGSPFGDGSGPSCIQGQFTPEKDGRRSPKDYTRNGI